MKFFIVDDDPDTLALVSRLLTDAGHEVVVRASSSGAARDIPEARPDCVITDLMMPVMDGFELISRLRSDPRYLRTPIIVSSGSPDPDSPSRALKLGANAYFTKPYSPIELRKKLQRLLKENDGDA